MRDFPSSVSVFDGSGNEVAETDYTYDQTSVSSASAVQHDEANFGSGSPAPRGNLTTVRRRCLQSCTDAVTTYTYDETGQMLTETDPCGNATCSGMTGSNHTTTFSYADNFAAGTGSPSGSTNGFITSVTKPSVNGVSFVTRYQWGYADGKLRRATDENGNITTYCYLVGGCNGNSTDPWVRLTQIINPDQGGTSVSYVDTGSSPSTTTATLLTSGQSITKTTVFDGIGHPIQTQLTSDPDGTDYVDMTYDGEGRNWTTSNPYRAKSDSTYGITTFTYDTLGRKLSEQEPGSGINPLQWIYTGNMVDAYDEIGLHAQRFSDGLGRLTQVLEQDGTSNYTATPSMSTTYSYNTLGNLLSVTQHGNGTWSARTRSFKYDSLSRLLQTQNPETGTICYGQWSAGGVGSGNCQNGYDANGSS